MRSSGWIGVVVAAGMALPIAVAVDGQSQRDPVAALGPAIEWRLDNLQRIGGHPVTVVGAPRVVAAADGAVVEFNGASDGLLVDANPLAGLGRFTVEVEFRPAAGGAEEQRFVHFQDASTENRALVELRMRADGAWALDTFLRAPAPGLTLLDRAQTHAADGWHTASLSYDGRAMTHAVDGVRQGRGDVVFTPLASGRTSLGMRQNRVAFFKGQIRRLRILPEAVQTIPLWPEGVPGGQRGEEQFADGRVSNVHVPTLTYLAPTAPATGTAVIMAPGGSYARLAMANEAAGVAARLQAEGVATFVLKYRLAEYGFPAPLQDVLRAVRVVRSRAAEFGVQPDRIGVMGASAGGHLAAMAGTLFDGPEGRTGAALDAVSARPDFLTLLYPVITMSGPHVHRDSTRNLLSVSPSPALVTRASADLQARATTPPTFLVHTAGDTTVPLEHSLAFYAALRREGVPAELHLYEQGVHGFGVRGDLGTTSAWPTRWTDWMRARGFLPSTPASPTAVTSTESASSWARGIEGQRKADLGNGSFRNPILAGDHPDPSILKDGADYYMTFSSFDAYPGLVIWHSRDLVNWQPIGPALTKNVGAVWAPDLVKHDGRYFIYFPGIAPYRSNYVVWADDIRGPWSAPIDLKIGRIDPGHAVGPDGRRYLFLSAGYRVPLAPDGLSVSGPETKVYDGWKYPESFVVEGFAQEGPKILRHGDYYYMVLAQGGTAGPPTGHMIVAARSRSIDGPWESAPHNPILRTQSADEPWWSKGHGTLVEDVAGRWWMVYHGYERGFLTLGRQTLLEPIEWTDDGWFRVQAGASSRAMAKPAGASGEHGFAFTDDFSANRMGVQWSFYAGDDADQARVRRADGALVLRAEGMGPATSSPLWFVAGDQAYEVEVDIDADPGASAGLLLFYSRRLYAGLGFSTKNFLMHSYGLDRVQAKPAHLSQRMRLRLRNDRHILTMHYSVDGVTWERYDRGMELSGYHHNVAYEFSSLRPALYAAGTGEVRFRNFKYRALP